MINFFVDFFSNIFNLVMVALFILVGILIGLILKPKAGKHVMKILPRDRRFIDFNIAEENAFSLECESKKGFPPQRFIKLRPGFTGRVGTFLKKAVTRFIGKEGTAYTWKTESAHVKIGTLADALKGLWGPKFYATIPDRKREELEESKIQVTVDLDDGLTPENMESVSEEDLLTEQDRKAAETYWQGKKQAEKGEWTRWIFIFVAGMGAMAIASKFLGWW